MGPHRYKGNGIYQYITEHHLESEYAWSVDNAWILLYANADLEPRLIALAVAVPSKSELTKAGFISRVEEKLWYVAECLARSSRMPLLVIRFEESLDEPVHFATALCLEGCLCGTDASFPVLEEVDSTRLCDVFACSGVDVQVENLSNKVKSINDASSSGFHIWQRHHLGRAVTAVDLDLCKMENEGTRMRPNTLFELKRSKIPFDKWMPYLADYPNYVLQERFAKKAGLSYQIVFNHYHMDNATKALIDDLDKLKVFCMADTMHPSFTFHVKNMDDVFNCESSAKRDDPSLAELIQLAKEVVSGRDAPFSSSLPRRSRDETR